MYISPPLEVAPLPFYRKCHKLVHNGRFQKFEVLYCSQINILYNLSIFSKNLVTKYILLNPKTSSELKSCNSFGCICHYGPVNLLLCMQHQKYIFKRSS